MIAPVGLREDDDPSLLLHEDIWSVSVPVSYCAKTRFCTYSILPGASTTSESEEVSLSLMDRGVGGGETAYKGSA